MQTEVKKPTTIVQVLEAAHVAWDEASNAAARKREEAMRAHNLAVDAVIRENRANPDRAPRDAPSLQRLETSAVPIEPIFSKVTSDAELAVRALERFQQAYELCGGGESGDVLREAVKLEQRLAAKAAAKASEAKEPVLK